MAVVMIVGSMISTNVAVVSKSGFTIVTAVLALHSCGFALGFFISKALGLSDKIARTNSIEVREDPPTNVGSPYTASHSCMCAATISRFQDYTIVTWLLVHM